MHKPNEIKDLINEFIWLIENRKLRIRFIANPDTILRIRKMNLSANPLNTIKDLKADIEILKDRIKKEREKLERHKLGY